MAEKKNFSTLEADDPIFIVSHTPGVRSNTAKATLVLRTTATQIITTEGIRFSRDRGTSLGNTTYGPTHRIAFMDDAEALSLMDRQRHRAHARRVEKATDEFKTAATVENASKLRVAVEQWVAFVF